MLKININEKGGVVEMERWVLNSSDILFCCGVCTGCGRSDVPQGSAPANRPRSTSKSVFGRWSTPKTRLHHKFRRLTLYCTRHLFSNYKYADFVDCIVLVSINGSIMIMRRCELKIELRLDAYVIDPHSKLSWEISHFPFGSV